MYVQYTKSKLSNHWNHGQCTYLIQAQQQSTKSQCQHLLLVVSVYEAQAQTSFYHFTMVVPCVTFGLLAVSAFLESSNIPTADWVRGEAVIIVKDDNPLSRLHTYILLIFCLTILRGVTYVEDKGNWLSFKQKGVPRWGIWPGPWFDLLTIYIFGVSK